MKVDLHMHTCFSDGGKSLQEIFDELNKQNVEIASITDHNNIDAYKHLNDINRHNIKIIKGIEVDVKTEDVTYHILMYGYNENSSLFKQYLNRSREYEISQFMRMISDLKEKFNIELNKEYVQKFIDNNQFFDKVRLNNLLCELGIAQSPKDAFYNFTKDIEDQKRLKINELEFFEMAKDCGAITSLAHPIKYLKNLSSMEKLQEAIIHLQELGLDAIEVYNNRQTLEDEDELLNFAKSQNLLITGGSDYHSKIGSNETKTLGKCLDRDLTIDKLTINLQKILKYC